MSYRSRLRIEGWALAACGALGVVVLLSVVDGASDRPGRTLGQLAVVAALLALLAPRAVQRWLQAVVPLSEDDRPAGEPTPLWHLPLVVASLCLPFALLDVPDAMVRVTGGCLLVGLAQALLLDRVVARFEAERDGVVYRLPGSRLGRGTKLGLMPGRPSERAR